MYLCRSDSAREKLLLPFMRKTKRAASFTINESRINKYRFKERRFSHAESTIGSGKEFISGARNARALTRVRSPEMRPKEEPP